MKKKITKSILIALITVISISCGNSNGNKSGSTNSMETQSEQVSTNPRDYVKVTSERGHLWISIQATNIGDRNLKRVKIKYRITSPNDSGKIKTETFSNLRVGESRSVNVYQSMGSPNYSLKFEDVSIDF